MKIAFVNSTPQLQSQRDSSFKKTAEDTKAMKRRDEGRTIVEYFMLQLNTKQIQQKDKPDKTQ